MFFIFYKLYNIFIIFYRIILRFILRWLSVYNDIILSFISHFSLTLDSVTVSYLLLLQIKISKYIRP